MGEFAHGHRCRIFNVYVVLRGWAGSPACGCEVRRAVGHLCNLLLTALNEREREKFKAFTCHYIVERKKFFGQSSPDDHKYPKYPVFLKYSHV